MKTKQISLLIALGCIGAGAATNYDLLGRKGSQMNSPMVYKNFNYSAKKSSLESQALAKQGLSGTALAIEGIHDPTMVDGLPRHGDGYEEADRYFIYKSSGVDRYWIGDEISGYTYAKRMNSYFTPIYRNRTQSQGSRSYKTVKKNEHRIHHQFLISSIVPPGRISIRKKPNPNIPQQQRPSQNQLVRQR